MKFEPMEHQKKAHELLHRRREFALFCEQGTGKTYITLHDAERLYEAGSIDAVLIIAPKGVHTNWTRREIPKLMTVPVVAEAFMSGLKTPLKRIAAMMKKKGALKVLTMNIDAVGQKAPYDLAVKFLDENKCMLVVDESSRIKNPSARRTKRVTSLGNFAVCKRILSGTPAPNSPADLFSQFHFLKPGLIGTTSYRAFVAQYAELLPPGHSQMRHIADRIKRKRPGISDEKLVHVLPQIVATDPVTLKPMYKNLDRLNEVIKPHCFRVTKAECLDLPPKVYQTFGFQLPLPQRRLYDKVREEFRLEFESDGTLFFNKLSTFIKLQQILSGFVMHEGETFRLEGKPERLEVLESILDDISGQFIVWARFREEITLIREVLAERNITAVEYHGGISDSQREIAVDTFQRGEARAFIGNAQAAGIGLTLTNAETAIYYSSDFNLESRLQSEDRCHRIGTKKTVVYIDIVAENTVDERVRQRLQAKEEVAEELLRGL